MSRAGGSFRGTVHSISLAGQSVTSLCGDGRDKVWCPVLPIRKEKVSESELQAGIQCLPIPLLSLLGCKAVSEVEGM